MAILKELKINFLSLTLSDSSWLIWFLCYFETLSLSYLVQFRMISLCLLRDLKKPMPETQRFVSIFILNMMMLTSSYSHPPPTSCSVTSDTNLCNCNFLWQLQLTIICPQHILPVKLLDEAFHMLEVILCSLQKPGIPKHQKVTPPLICQQCCA